MKGQEIECKKECCSESYKKGFKEALLEVILLVNNHNEITLSRLMEAIKEAASILQKWDDRNDSKK